MSFLSFIWPAGMTLEEQRVEAARQRGIQERACYTREYQLWCQQAQQWQAGRAAILAQYALPDAAKCSWCGGPPPKGQSCDSCGGPKGA